MVNAIKTLGIATLVAALAASSVYAKPSTSNTNSYNNNDSVKSYSITKEEDISDKIRKDTFMVDNLLCSNIEYTNYYSVRGKDNLYELFVIKSNKKPEYLETIRNEIKGGNKKTASAWGFTISDFNFFNASVKYWGDNIYSFLLKTIIEDPEKKFEIEMPVENEKKEKN